MTVTLDKAPGAMHAEVINNIYDKGRRVITKGRRDLEDLTSESESKSAEMRHPKAEKEAARR